MGKGKTKVDDGHKVGLGKLLLWNTSAVSVTVATLVLAYITYYCTDALYLEPAIVAIVFAASKVFDSVTNVLAGFIIDRTNTRWGKGRPYEVFMILLWLATWLLFSCPEGLSTVMKYVWIFFMYVFMNAVCCTFLNGNNVVYMVRAFRTQEQQTKVVAYANFFNMAAGFVFNIAFPIAMTNIATDASGWSRLVGMLAIPQEEERYLLVKDSSASYRLPISKIDYVEVLKHYLIYHIGAEEYKTRGTIREAEAQLASYHFSRCHNCFLVNLKRVESVTASDVRVGQASLPLSRYRKQEFMQDFARCMGEV